MLPASCTVPLLSGRQLTAAVLSSCVYPLGVRPEVGSSTSASVLGAAHPLPRRADGRFAATISRPGGVAVRPCVPHASGVGTRWVQHGLGRAHIVADSKPGPARTDSCAFSRRPFELVFPFPFSRQPEAAGKSSWQMAIAGFPAVSGEWGGQGKRMG